MKRILAIDYGTKRTGLAVTDPQQIIASGLTTVETSQLLLFLHNYMAKEPVECLVIGNPKNLDNTPAQSADSINQFTKKLKITYPEMPVYSIDERFTSKIASQEIAGMGLKKKDREKKELIDAVSAVMLLQEWMNG